MSANIAQLAEQLRTASETQILPHLLQCDAAGLLLAPSETIAQFAERLHKLQQELTKLSASDPAYAPLVQAAAPLDPILIAQAQAHTWLLYGFKLNWLPAYCSRRRTGIFSAGILYIIDDILPVVFLAASTSIHRGYPPAEVLAHEMIHAARQPFSASSYDEYFSWQTSSSHWRRNCGNFFRNWWRPALFLFGIGLPGLELLLQGTFTWGALGMVLSAALIAHEIKIRRVLQQARQKLEAQGIAPAPALLRLTDAEIRHIARRSGEQIPQFLQQFWRGRIILQRFRLNPEPRDEAGACAVHLKFQ